MIKSLHPNHFERYGVELTGYSLFLCITDKEFVPEVGNKHYAEINQSQLQVEDHHRDETHYCHDERKDLHPWIKLSYERTWKIRLIITENEESY